jgi:hypothetical protein
MGASYYDRFEFEKQKELDAKEICRMKLIDNTQHHERIKN